MPKYRNKEKFIQPIRVGQNRIVVKPGEVVFIERELDLSIYSFLEIVPDNTPVSNITNQKPIIKEQVSSLKTDINNVKSEILKEVDVIKKDLKEEILNSTELKDINEKIDVVLKRLEVIKNAVTILDTALHNLEKEVYENNTFVLDEEKE